MEKISRKVREKQFAELFDGDIEGAPSIVIIGASSLDFSAEKDLSFLVHRKYFRYLYSTKASTLLVYPDYPVCLKKFPVENP
ncbi:MAG: LpxD N-terminal domain-containing protein [bacterium]